jgi:HAD superfamily hydrolase (TIGR01509 family)
VTDTDRADRRRPALVIFDCDGVLVDSEPISARVMAEMAVELGLKMTADAAIARFTGISLGAVMALLEAELGRPLPPDFRRRLQERDYARFRESLQPVAGVREALARLRLPRCIASSGSFEKMAVTLAVTGLEALFAPHIFSASQVVNGKPAPDLFLFVADRMGTPPAACVVVEDSVAGIRGARTAGMRAFGFAGASHAGPGYGAMLAEAGADLVFDDMTTLPALLANGSDD